MTEPAEQAEQLQSGVDPVERVFEFLGSLDSNGRAGIEGVLMACFDKYVVSLPGPDAFVKRKARPHVESAIKNFVTDLCSRG